MAAFQFFVHQTAAIIKNVNSTPLNFPIGGFYDLETAVKFGAMIAKNEKLNRTVVYSINGDLVKDLTC